MYCIMLCETTYSIISQDLSPFYAHSVLAFRRSSDPSSRPTRAKCMYGYVRRDVMKDHPFYVRCEVPEGSGGRRDPEWVSAAGDVQCVRKRRCAEDGDCFPGTRAALAKFVRATQRSPDRCRKEGETRGGGEEKLESILLAFFLSCFYFCCCCFCFC